MATDERNFRSTYYEKVGCRSVEEKKSLNILLKDNPLNLNKLKQFCLSYSVPTEQRALLWNIILDILPVYSDNQEFVRIQRQDVYKDILQAITVMNYIDERTPKYRILYIMWLLENKKLAESNIYQEHVFLDITKVLLKVFDDDVHIYWIAKEFYEFTKEINSEIPKIMDLLKSLLEKEDNKLFKHFEKYNLFESLPITKWFSTCFAGLISAQALVRVWDKICGGSRKIVVFVLLVLFKTFRMALLGCSQPQQVIAALQKANHQDDLIINKAIESWQNNQSHSEFVVH